MIIREFSAIIKKANGKILLAFCQGNHVDADFRVGKNKYMIPAALYVLLNKF